MVHALEKIHDLLKNDEVKQAGLIGHRLDYALHKKAFEALDQVVDDGLFVFERLDSFPYLYHAETLDIMRKWISENWSNSTLDEETIRRAEELENTTEKPSRVVVQQDLHISRLRSI
jgi:hypothetical protein